MTARIFTNLYWRFAMGGAFGAAGAMATQAPLPAPSSIVTAVNGGFGSGAMAQSDGGGPKSR